ncbi:hypothetical protein DXT99_00325 [Pontibacter diazotrophicus]|uniref:Uncharacterized protein n=1 Tax=Pontibacter diazotrophicus TaxID=1400979 RepID=A0A3D8LHS9_9BACT|nr:hypothetical protein [Pontibacter diazotrophicus]RDV17000.1 hypothetical protein DXT99_00325 [Pontibacter diazotrophicus]
MPKYKLTWEEADAQFLEALLLATGGEGGATLQDVLLMADAIDGTVFTLEEVEQALEKLVAIDYVSVLKNKLSLSPTFHEANAQVEESTADQEQLLQSLQAQELTEQSIEEARSALKKYKLKNYYQQYQEQFGG